MNDTIYSYAKINFGLKVLFRYPNGYHHINSLFLPIDFSDTMHFSLTSSPLQKKFCIEWVHDLNSYYEKNLTPYFSGDKIDQNILMKSFDWFLLMIHEKLPQMGVITQVEKERAIKKISSFRLNIQKSIPSPAGLGGGSSNSATLIKFLVKIVFGESHEKYHTILLALGEEIIHLGADIPFFFLNKPALITGIGKIQERCDFPLFFGILGIPSFGFPTSLVYQALNSPLQDEKSFDDSSDWFIDPFRRLVDYVQEKQVASFRLASLSKDMMRQEERGVVYIKNDLLDAANQVNPNQVKFIKTLMSELARAIHDHFDKRQNVYYSMSGSGGSFFAIGNFMKNQLDVVCGAFQEKYKEVQWKVFSVIGP